MTVLSRSACSDCGKNDWKKDNWIEYEDNFHCHACGKHESKKGKITMIEKQEVSNQPLNTSGSFQSLSDRGLSKETCEDYGVRFNANWFGQEIHEFDYKKQGVTVSIKRRLANKEFPWEQYNGDVEPFGMHLACNKDKAIIITEGEFDAMAIYEANQEHQAVSIPLGAQGASSFIKKHLELLLLFKEVILWFDNDDAGKAALQKVKEFIPFGKFKYIQGIQGFKDANDILLHESGIKLIADLIDNSSEITPPGINFGHQIDFKALGVADPVGATLPFPKVNELIRGLKKGRLYVIGAGTGVGKSTFMREMAFHLMTTDPKIRIANIFLEENQTFTLQAYCALAHNIPEFKVAENPSLIPNIEKEAKKLLGHDRYAFLDHFGSLQNRKLLELLDYLATEKKFDLIILDHISIVISGMKSSKEGERRDIDVLMTKLRELIAKTNVTVIAASHLKRLDGEQGFENGKHVTLNSFRGSGTLTQIPDVVIGLERNTQADSADKSIIRILKNRITGKLGEADTLVYVENTGRLLEINEAMKRM